MAYSELIKNFERIRDYMRQFYVYGFRSRNDYDAKSARSYDNERRRIESWLGEYMEFRQDKDGKRMFISVDSRSAPENPLYKAFKAKSFTNNDIAFHFYILDTLHDGEKYTVSQIMEQFTSYTDRLENPLVIDESTVRKKLKEYTNLGIIRAEKYGRELIYSLPEKIDLAPFENAVSFFSEENPLGVIGSFILDKTENKLIFIERDEPLSRSEVEEKLSRLREVVDADPETVRRVMMELIPTFRDPNAVNSAADESEEMKIVAENASENSDVTSQKSE
jgi:DNA-binding transcriptional ArsR family regulator